MKQYEDMEEEARSKSSAVKQQYSNWLVHKAGYEPLLAVHRGGTVVVPVAQPWDMQAWGDINHGPPLHRSPG